MKKSMFDYGTRHKYFRELGFRDKTILYWEKRSPKMFPIAFAEKKIKGLRRRGFKDPVGIIKRSPHTIFRSLNTISRRIEEFREYGFKNPIELIESSPAILGHSSKKLSDILDWLHVRGFKDPFHMIMMAPSLATFQSDFHVLDQKLKYGRRLQKFGVEVMSLIEARPVLLTYSLTRIRLVARITLSLEDGNVRAFTTLIRAKQLPLVAGRLTASQPLRQSLWRRVRIRNGHDEENRSIIANSIFKDHKIVRDYSRYMRMCE